MIRPGLGTRAVSTGLSYNVMGKPYLEFDKAEEYLLKSFAICNVKGDPFDVTVTLSRENLAQLEELKKKICPDSIARCHCQAIL